MIVRYVMVSMIMIHANRPSILVILRDSGLPLPAGAILISPWVDLTHSFPSVAGDGSFDYIPAHGFHHRPSASWPPPNTYDIEEIAMHAIEQVAGEAMPRKSSQAARHKAQGEAIQGFSLDNNPGLLDSGENPGNPYGSQSASKRPDNMMPGAGHDLSFMLDGKLVRVKDQIQMYTTNQLISHPLVSPVLQPSLGGLPPLLILTGGGELLRDEQIYLAHKAANPAKYPPGEAYLDNYPEARDSMAKWKPTNVQLQVWDDLCHVAPTLSFTRPAKYMYRSIAQFGAWALARAQKTEIQIMDDEEVSLISESDTGSNDDLEKAKAKTTIKNKVTYSSTTINDEVGRAGQPLPSFKNHMIRQRVDRHGNIFPLDPPSSLPALQISSNEVGVIKPGPVQKWLNAKKDWDTKYVREKRKVQRQRVKEMAKGYQGFGDDEVPPPSALAGRRGLSMPKTEKRKRSWGMSLWASWGSTHDEQTMNREEKADKEIGIFTPTETDGAKSKPTDAERGHAVSHSRSRRRNVSDVGQANVDENTSVVELRRRLEEILPTDGMASDHESFTPLLVASEFSTMEPYGQVASQSLSPNVSRPKSEGIAFPFKLSTHLVDDGRNASTITLESQAGVVTPQSYGNSQQLGDSMEHRMDGGRDGPGYEQTETPTSAQEEKSPVAVINDEEWKQDSTNKEQSPIAVVTDEERKRASTQEEKSPVAVIDDEGWNHASRHEEKFPIAEPAESDDEGWKQAAQDAKMRLINGGDDQEYPGMRRRGTLEDVQGDSYHGPNRTEGPERKRPQLDRAETASLD